MILSEIQRKRRDKMTLCLEYGLMAAEEAGIEVDFSEDDDW